MYECVCGGWSNDSNLAEMCSCTTVAYSDSSHGRDDVNLGGRSCDFKATNILEEWEGRRVRERGL